MAINPNAPAGSAVEMMAHALQGKGSYDLSKDYTARRWAAVYPIVPRKGIAIQNPLAQLVNLPASAPNWVKNITSPVISTGRTLIGQRLKMAFVPYNIDTNVWGGTSGTNNSTPSVATMQLLKNLFSASYHKWGRKGAADSYDAEFTGLETLPLFSDIFGAATPTLSTLSMGSYGGDRAGEYRFPIPVVFGQTVEMIHTVDYGADPYTIAPGLWNTGASAAAGLAADWTLVFYVEGILSRLGV
jgi:hypothetical protein